MTNWDIIIKILKDHEEDLSDGYGWYSRNVDVILYQIADEILKSIKF